MKFEPNDFKDFNSKVIPGEVDSLEAIANIANAKLEEWLRDAPTVYMNVEGGVCVWEMTSDFEKPRFIYKAKLVCINSMWTSGN